MGLAHSADNQQPTIKEPSIEPENQSNNANADAPTITTTPEDRNPGILSDLHRKCDDLMPVSFEGVKILLNNHLSAHFQTSHLINIMSNNMRSGASAYKFNTTFVGTRHLTDSPHESYPVVYGDIDSEGNVNANVVHYVTQRLRVRYNGMFRASPSAAQAQLMAEYFGRDFTVSLVGANLNQERQPEVLVGQYLRAFSKHLDLGAEVCYNNANTVCMVPFAKRLGVTVAGRLETGAASMVAVTWGTIAGLQVSSYRKASESLQIGVEAMVNRATKEVVTRLVYQATLPSRHYVFRGMVDSKGTVGSSLEKSFEPFPLKFTVSAFINHSKNHFRLGCGFVLK